MVVFYVDLSKLDELRESQQKFLRTAAGGTVQGFSASILEPGK